MGNILTTVIASAAKQSFVTRINVQIASEVPSSQRRFFVFLELPYTNTGQKIGLTMF